MPTWGELLQRLLAEASANGGNVPLDEIRRQAVAKLTELTGRPTIVYASRWVQGGGSPEQVSVGVGDVHAFMEVLHQLKGPELNLVLHSGGGSPTAAEAVINYVRTRFERVRVYVPLAAMSAATMMACAADVIVMGKHSSLGPIDPQLVLQTPLGVQAVPALAIRDQFRMAEKRAGNHAQFAAWIPMLQQYGPGLLVQCENVITLSENLVRTWLAKWMFKGHRDAKVLAKKIAAKLNDHKVHLVHGRFLPRDQLQAMKLRVESLEDNQDEQDAVLTILHALTHTFTINGAVMKIVENNIGKAVVSMAAAPRLVQPQGVAFFAPGPVGPPPPGE